MIRRLAISVAVILALFALWQPQPAYAAGSIFLAPNSGTYGLGSTITMRVVVGTGGQAINAAQASISYDTARLEVLSVSRNSSIFSLWPAEPQASGGVISFSGGLPTPGYTGNGGLLITVTFRARATGTAITRVTSGRVLLNDGLGTNILTGYGSATYTINQAPPTTTITPTGPVPAAPTLRSSTHPDQSLWYAKGEIAFDWDREEGVLDFSYSHDLEAASEPDTDADTDQTSLTLPYGKDGVTYFHLRARNENGWGAVTHFRIRNDTTPPEPFTIRLEGENPTGLREPMVHFSTTDALSGVQNYRVRIDGGDAIVVDPSETEPFTLPTLEYGEHRIDVEAQDFAGNIQSATLAIKVVDRVQLVCTATNAFFTLNGNSLLGPIIALFLLFLIIVYARQWYYRHLAERRKETIETLQQRDQPTATSTAPAASGQGTEAKRPPNNRRRKRPTPLQ